MLVVLGFDSLDARRIKTVETPTFDKLAESGTMHTFEGLEPSELATTVLWSSMLAGQNPKELYPEYYSSDETFNPWLRGEWSHPVLNSSPARIAEGFVVRRLSSLLSRQHQEQLRTWARNKIGKRSFVHNRLLSTDSVLDGSKSPHLISVPGINFDVSSKALKDFVNSSGGVDLADEAGTEAFEREGIRADADRLIRTLYAIESGNHDFIMTHFFSLDLIQHIWAGSQRKMQRWYGLYDHFLSQVLDTVGPDDTVVVVSDHGMEDSGIHSKRSFYGATKAIWDDEEYHVERLAEVLRAELGNHTIVNGDGIDTPGVSPEVTEHLEDLGYF